jgi:hypothetical protein
MDVFSFHNQFSFLAAYLVGLGQRVSQWTEFVNRQYQWVTNLRHSKLLLKDSS